MTDTQYELRYLPLFYDDLEQKLTYISETLHNKKAANDLLDAVESAIVERLPFAEAFEPFCSIKENINIMYLCKKFCYLLCCN